MKRESIQVKACGITDLADARYIASFGAEKVGFIQVPESPRFIPPDGAKAIIEWLSGSDPVGVFVNRSSDEINRIADSTGFKWVQLHGEESVDECRLIRFPVIKAFRVRSTDRAEDVINRMSSYESAVTLFLLDTFSEAEYGGTGQTFDWDLAREVARRFPVMLAGGITPENVADAVSQVNPLGIDVSSGIEMAPGKKDFDKIDALFEAIAPFRTP